MRTSIAALLGAVLLAGCQQGPGHTRAAGAGIGAASGALIGAAAAGPGSRGTGAAVGGILGLVTGSMVGDGIAQDQERCCPPPCAEPCPPPPCGPTRITRRRYVRPDGTLIREEEIIEEDVVVHRR